MRRAWDTSQATSFGDTVNAGLLILDGDGLCYEAAATSKTLPLALKKLTQKVMELMFLLDVSECRMHLTASGSKKNYRGGLLGVKPYQGNRQGKAKPALLEPLRIAAAREGAFHEGTGITAILHRHLEADDGMMQDAYAPSALRKVLVSADKDLQIAPCPLYDVGTGKLDCIADRFGWVQYDEDKGKIVGHGTAFFWAQMLYGDAADNVQGLLGVNRKTCGAVSAWQLLQDVKGEDAAANLVIGLYRCIQQNPWPEAYALWLLRTEDDHIAHYFNSIKWDAANAAFLSEMYKERWIQYGSSEESETCESM